MQYTKSYTEMLNLIEQRRSRALFEAEQKRRTLLENNPRLREIETAIAEAGLTLFHAQVSGTPAARAMAEYEEMTGALERERTLLLAQLGIRESDFKPEFFCPDCEDTGFIGDRKCHCLESLLQEALFSYYDLSAVTDSARFETFNPEVFDEAFRAQGQKIFSLCWNFCERFETDGTNVLFFGGPGRGKTFMCSCIAGKLIEQGRNVIYVTAGHLVDLAREKTSGDAETKSTFYQSLKSCDLLIIDDLGAEYKTAFSESVLFDVINTRLIDHKKMIISTNLNTETIAEVYDPRISSRINGHFKKIFFSGKDLRARADLNVRD